MKKFTFLWKVWRRALSIEEFSYLLQLSDVSLFAPSNEDTKTAKWLLKQRFKYPLNVAEMDLLVQTEHVTAQNIWLMAVKHRKLDKCEEQALIERMPWNGIRRFPSQLSEQGLYKLFYQGFAPKIVSYCRDYALPESFEKLLIEKYQISLKKVDEQTRGLFLSGKKDNDWRKALLTYLEKPSSGERFKTYHMQQMLINLNDEGLTEKLILRSDIVQNCMDNETIRYLIDQNNVEAIRLLLRESYLPKSQFLTDFLKEKMPQLTTQYLIAEYRRMIYLKEQEMGLFFGALTFRKAEESLMYEHLLAKSDEMEDFVMYKIAPNIEFFGPCMCAYLAYYFPYLAGQLLKSEFIRFYKRDVLQLDA